MLKNERLIHRLTLEEKISLVLSNVKGKSSSVPGYEFPEFNLMADPFKGKKNIRCTSFPDYKALSMTFNNKLIEDVAKLKGEENFLFTSEPFFSFETKLDKNLISDDPIIAGNFLLNYFKGLSNTESLSCLDVCHFEGETRQAMIDKEIFDLSYDKVLRENYTDYIIVSTVHEMAEYKTERKVEGKFFAKPTTKQEVCRFINNGVFQIFYEGDFEEVKEYLVHAADVYQNIHGNLKNNVISSREYNDQIVEGKALDLEALDEACDNYVTFLLKLDKEKRRVELESSLISDENKLPYKSVEHNEVALDAAREAIVLLKNDNQVLPLSPKKRVAIIGDSFKNAEYYYDLFTHKPAYFKTPFDTIKEYIEIDYIGYAHGYLKGHETDDRLIDSACKLVKEAGAAIIYLWADEETKSIPENQLKVLDAIYNEKSIPIIAVVNATSIIDFSFEDKCSAIVFVPNVGEGMSKATFDVITGNENPSGRLVTDAPELVGDEYISNGLPGYTKTDIPKRYPFGYGLSYTTFEYSHLVLNSEGATFNLTNTGEFPGYEVVELYVSKKDSDRTLKNKMFRGFKKVFLNKGETVKVSIKFDENTFRYYNKERNCFGIEGGRYYVYIGSSYDSVRLEGSLNLNRFLDRRFAYEESEALTPESFHEFENKADKAKAMMCGVKLFVSIALGLYLIGVEAFIWSYLLYDRRSILTETFYLGASGLLLAIAAAIVVIVIVYNVKNFKKRSKLIADYINSDLTLTNLITNIEEFPVEERVVYDVTPEVVEEEVVEELPAEEVIVPVVEEEPVEEAPQEEEVKEEEPQEEFQEVELAMEEEAVEQEEIVDLDEAELSDEEIKAHEMEEIQIMEAQNQDKEIADDFEEYEDNTTFDDSTSLSQTVDRFMVYAENRGVIFELSSVRSLFANIASAKVMILTSKVRELLPLAVEILNDFLGNKSHIFEAGDMWSSSFYLSWKKNEEGEYVKTEFVNDVYNACRFKNNLNLAILNNVNMDNIDSYFGDFIHFANNPTRPHMLKLNNRQSLRIPENLTIVLIPKDDDYMDHLSKDLATASSCIEIIMRKNDMAQEEYEKPDALSYNYLNELIYEAKKTWYLEEESWKRIDEFEAELNHKEPFKINNKLVVSIEKYTSVFIDCGGDEKDALDSVVSERIIPMVKTLKIYKEEDGIKKLTELVEKCFGEEFVSKTKRVLQSSLKQE